MCSGRDVADFALAPVGLQVGGASGGNAAHNVVQKKPLSTNAKAAGVLDAIGAGAAASAASAPAGAAAAGEGSASTAATGVAPAATQGFVGETAAETAAAAPGATAATSGALTVKDVVQLTAAAAGTASAAYGIYAAKHAPKPPGMEAPPPVPQSGVQPDFTAIRKKNLFGDDGPFARDATFLTGPGGVKPGSTNLGRNILLGN